MQWKPRPAREVALRILDELFRTGPTGGTPEPGGPYALTPFQEEAVFRLRAIMSRRGGAVLADSVGLGKTYIALALVQSALAGGHDVLVAVPAALRPLWARLLARLGSGSRCRLVTHGQLSRGWAPPGDSAPGLVVIDEAHRFRNPATRRYVALARIALLDPPPRVLLVTATPVNNSPEDLYHLLRLFATDAAFQDQGVPSLSGAFLPKSGGREVQAVVRSVVVRRTRAMLEIRYGRPAAHSAPAFPQRADPARIRYRDPGLAALVQEIEGLELTPYEGDSSAATLLRLGLLKRLDSSSAGFLASISRLRRTLRRILAAAEAGRCLKPSEALPGRDRRGDADPLQLVLVDLLAAPASPDADLDGLMSSLRRDLDRLDRISGMSGPDDGKLEALESLLRTLRGEKVLIFTEYRDTAAAVWEHLTLSHRVGRIDGGGAWLGRRPAGRRMVVERFAPRANGRPHPPDRERIDILVATDVLAEGMNLQDARHVISYDLPWNPVRLLQRIGRVDRLGSPHREVMPYLFVPAEGLDSLLGLRRRLIVKLDGIAGTVGGERVDALLEALGATRSAPSRIAVALRSATPDRPEESDLHEELRTLWIRHRDTRTPETEARGPASVADGGPPWLILARSQHAAALVEVHSGGRVKDATADVLPVLRRALECESILARPKIPSADGSPAPTPTPRRAPAPVPPVVTRAVLRFLATRGAAARAPAGLTSRTPARALAARLKDAVARSGAAATPALLRRADRLLQELASPLHPATAAAADAALEELNDSHDLTATLRVTETALAPAAWNGDSHSPGRAPRGRGTEDRIATEGGWFKRASESASRDAWELVAALGMARSPDPWEPVDEPPRTG